MNTTKLDAVEQGWAAAQKSNDCFVVKYSPEKTNSSTDMRSRLHLVGEEAVIVLVQEPVVLSQPDIPGGNTATNLYPHVC